MPTSIDPPPADDEIECARCGAHFYYELTRCPNCGVNLYEPDDEPDRERPQKSLPRQSGLLAWLDGFFRQITRRPYPADELFGAAINQAELFNNLLRKVGGDRSTVERLVDFERQQSPKGNRMVWLENAVRRWEKDNRASGNDQ
jgi:predicted  nucleic acid-binding Zn-ribbon protein